MAKKLTKTSKRDIKRAAIVQETAATLGVSPRYVRMVLAGDRDSEKILAVYMELTEGHNALLDAVKNLLPEL